MQCPDIKPLLNAYHYFILSPSLLRDKKKTLKLIENQTKH